MGSSPFPYLVSALQGNMRRSTPKGSLYHPAQCRSSASITPRFGQGNLCPSAATSTGSTAAIARRASTICATHNHLLFEPHTSIVPSPRPLSARRRFAASCRSSSSSHHPGKMTAQKIDGTAIAKKIRERLGEEIKKKQETNPRYKPSLRIIQVGDRSDSSEQLPFLLVRRV
jgi:hypothetical protein